MKKYDVDSGQVQFGKTSEDYAKFRPGFPESFFEQLKAKEYVHMGDPCLDLGTGTGTIARGLQKLGCIPYGVDPSESLLNEARKIDEQRVVYKIGTAEKIPFNDSKFHLVAAGQCWHWFDPQAAAKEIARVLKKDGILIIANFDWMSEPGNVVGPSLELVPQFSPEWTPEKKPAFFKNSADVVQTPDGFHLIEEYQYVEPVFFSLDRWCGRMRASAAIGATLPVEKVKAYDDALRKKIGHFFERGEIPVSHWVTTRVYRNG